LGAALGHHGRDPGGGVGADQPELLAARLAEGVEEAAKRPCVMARGGPHQPAGVVVDDHGEVSPTAQGQGAVFVAEGAAAVHDALPNTTFIVQRAVDFTPNDGICTIAPTPPAGWITLTTLTTSAGGAGTAHFERAAPRQVPPAFSSTSSFA
jgi:hypothetical protein